MLKFLGVLVFVFGFSANAFEEGYVETSFFQGTEVMVGTELPFQIGARMKIQLPWNIHLVAGLGYVPEFYADGFGTMAGSVGIMGENTAEVAGKALAGAFVVDVRAAYSLDPDGGFFLELGYALISGGSGDVSGDVAESAYDFDYTGFNENDTLSVEASMHALTAHIGFLYLISERLSLVLDVGLVKPIVAEVDTTASGVPAATASQIESDMNAYLEDVIVSEMFIPTASVWMSYLF